MSDIECKYFTTSKYNKFTNNILHANRKEKKLVNKSNKSGFINNSVIDKNIATLATKGKLKPEQNKIVKLQTFDSFYFRNKSYFEDNGTQNYLVFQPIYRFFKKISNTNHGNLMDCPLKVLNPLPHLIIVVLRR